MALQIRRGLEADRLSITPLAGELLYVTDTKNIYVGDGTTAGGALVTGDVLDDTTPQLGGDLDLNGNDIVGTGSINIDGTITATGNINLGDAAGDNINVSGSINTNLIPKNDSAVDIGSAALRWRNGYFAGLQVDGQIDAVSMNANIVADNSTVAYNSATNTFTGNFDGQFTGSIFSDDSTQLIDGINKTVTASISSTDGTQVLINGTDGTNARFIGDITALDTTKMVDATNKVINIDVINASTLNGNVSGNVTGNVTGNTTGYHTGDVQGSVFADGSTLLVDAVAGTIPGENITGTITATFAGNLTGNVTGTLIGNVVGDVQGSVFADNSTLLVDGLTGELYGTFLGTVNTDAPIRSSLNQGTVVDNVGIEFSMFRGTTVSPLEPNDFDRTNITWNSYDPGTSTYRNDAVVIGYHQSGGGGYIAFSAADASYTLFNTSVELDGKTGVVSVVGNMTVSNGITADITGSLFSDASTMLIDGTNGSLVAANVDIVGSVAGTPSVGAGDLANVNEWLEVTVNGNTRYIPLYA